jgi:hypothetical protein
VRLVRGDDVPAIADVYAEAVLNGTVSFEARAGSAPTESALLFR